MEQTGPTRWCFRCRSHVDASGPWSHVYGRYTCPACSLDTSPRRHNFGPAPTLTVPDEPRVYQHARLVHVDGPRPPRVRSFGWGMGIEDETVAERRKRERANARARKRRARARKRAKQRATRRRSVARSGSG